ncbi:MAG: translesion error-prone DNA polymerase V autoproteolytic subunit [SAR324 cluster bacterium]|nr:translesion error-prone DNA polymerase V autoproteolytic subunit [SAR324 cluster bacterium]
MFISKTIHSIHPARTETAWTGIMFYCRVSAGFPSPADDYMDNPLDLNDYLIKNKAATFYVRVEGDSMIGAGIHHGDLLIVDRSIKPVSGKVVIAVLDGDLTVKRLIHQDNRCCLVAENPKYPPLEIDENHDFQIWGVVTGVIHEL